eukprot:TRINITY_DN3618_c0_g1_i1.p1 TRINITY_DN3618_c0_g1~~TRINITY_DN3618_c0_g1_i1.p1  ORF type:complete len:849 (+),score=209.38 TRINITY_DN3618_c0_g1_i1:46-2592(+)
MPHPGDNSAAAPPPQRQPSRSVDELPTSPSRRRYIENARARSPRGAGHPGVLPPPTVDSARITLVSPPAVDERSMSPPVPAPPAAPVAAAPAAGAPASPAAAKAFEAKTSGTSTGALHSPQEPGAPPAGPASTYRSYSVPRSRSGSDVGGLGSLLPVASLLRAARSQSPVPVAHRTQAAAAETPAPAVAATPRTEPQVKPPPRRQSPPAPSRPGATPAASAAPSPLPVAAHASEILAPLPLPLQRLPEAAGGAPWRAALQEASTGLMAQAQELLRLAGGEAAPQGRGGTPRRCGPSHALSSKMWSPPPIPKERPARGAAAGKADVVGTAWDSPRSACPSRAPVERSPSAEPPAAPPRELLARLEALERENYDLRRERRNQRIDVSALSESLRATRRELRRMKAALADHRTAASDMKRSMVFMQDGIVRDISDAVLAAREDAYEQGAAYFRGLYQAAERERRALHHQVQQLLGAVRVVARVRPLLPHEPGPAAPRLPPPADPRRPTGDTVVMQRGAAGQKLHFTFDAVFGPDATQDDLFTEVADVATSCLDGHGCCVLAYGQTGSGKTHTMLGDGGVTLAVLSDIFTGMKEREAGGGYEYKFYVSVVEVYNDSVTDLLAAAREPPHRVASTSGSSHVSLKDVDLEEIEVTHGEQDLLDVLFIGEDARVVGESNHNARSTRSHLIVRGRVAGTDRISGRAIDGRVMLADLAGSERLQTSTVHRGSSVTQSISKATLRETQYINKSLSALGDVVQALAAGAAHVPYRNARLTHFLHPCLKKGSKVVVIANVSPSAAVASETICTLQFAARARAVLLGEARGTARGLERPRSRGLSTEAGVRRSRSAPHLPR